MRRWEITLSTPASLTVTVSADTDEEALNIAGELAERVSEAYIPVAYGVLDLNEAWQLHEPTIEEVKE